MGDGTAFERQFSMQARDYLAGLDFYTWTRHFHVLRDLCERVQGDVLEVGAGDGVVRRCALPFMRSYRVMDINARLEPDVLGDVLQPQPALVESFDAVVCSEVLEHLPFDRFEQALINLRSYVRPAGILLLTLPHRKAHCLFVTPRQRLHAFRLPIGLTSLSEAYHRFVRRRIWIDPHHHWEIGDGRVLRVQVQAALRRAALRTERFAELPYCDYWVLSK